MSVYSINSVQDFEDKALKAATPVLVDFWASWCNPCKMVAPEVEAAATELAGKVFVCKVNIDELSGLADRYNVRSIPTLLVLKDGKEANRIVGFRPRRDIISALSAL